MVFITAVTSVTKINALPLSAHAMRHRIRHYVYPYHYRTRPPANSGDRGD